MAKKQALELDAAIIGAGFGGMYMLIKLRELGFTAQVYEAADDVGGTWYWNRYPGARCDVESQEYQYSFSDELQREWDWTERYATQPEILAYAQHVADKFDLRPDIQFETRVESAHYNEQTDRWEIVTDQGDAVSARVCVSAVGCLSTTSTPDFPGLDAFSGPTYHTGNWPHGGVDFEGQRVGVIGTGSSGVQVIPQIAAQANDLTVFQRTPNYSIPAQNDNLPAEKVQRFKDEFLQLRKEAAGSGFGAVFHVGEQAALEVTEEDRQQEYETRWQEGGPAFLVAYTDLLVDKAANDTAAEFVRGKLGDIVEDADVAELLAPKDHPLGTKRICVDINYFETYNKPSVHLVGVKDNPIRAITPDGLQLEGGQEFAFDVLVLATGFDAMTGTLMRIDIEGREQAKLADAWADGPRTYLGLSMAGFPNFFTITGPGSPSVFSNMIISIEQHVEWIADCMTHMRANDVVSIEATEEAQDGWVDHVNETANATLFPKTDSWYVGANIPGKPRVFTPYIAGVGPYRMKCDEVAAQGYEGFALSKESIAVN